MLLLIMRIVRDKKKSSWLKLFLWWGMADRC